MECWELLSTITLSHQTQSVEMPGDESAIL